MKFFIFLTLLWSVSHANEGTSVGTSTLNHFKNNFTATIANPMTSDAKFKTVDGSKEFQSNLSCDDNPKKFLNISYTNTSDIDLSVSIDKNLDGTIDENSNYANVSGVCTNGFVKCDSNTWNNCKYYKFSFSGSLSAVETQRDNIGGCYCTNSSCGSIALNNKKQILNDIGGGISALLSKYYNNYIISETQNNSLNIKYFAQNTQTCQNYNNTPSFSSSDSSALSAATDNLKTTQLNDEDSIYYSFVGSSENQLDNDFSSDIDEIEHSRSSVDVTGDASTYTFEYTSQIKDDNGSWTFGNGNDTLNIDFANPEVKFCEVKYLTQNSVIHTDNSEHSKTSSEDQTWQSDIRECTGEEYDQCPTDSTKGEMIKHACGEISNFAEVVSALSAVNEMSDDMICSQ